MRDAITLSIALSLFLSIVLPLSPSLRLAYPLHRHYSAHFVLYYLTFCQDFVQCTYLLYLYLHVLFY